MSQAKPPFKASPLTPSPPPPRKLRQRIFHLVKGNVRVAGAVVTHQIYSRDGEEGGVICGSMPFDNGSSDWVQIQHEDGQ